jgi:hypothetical protein
MYFYPVQVCIRDRDFTVAAVAALPADNIELHIYTLLISDSTYGFDINVSDIAVMPLKLKNA